VHVFPSSNSLSHSVIGIEENVPVEEGFKIYNPRDLIERSLSFVIEIKDVKFDEISQTVEKIKIEYELLESNYKTRKYETPEVQFSALEGFSYTRNHSISEISENTILHYTDRPIAFSVQGIIRL
jgi:hypothetical protein